MKSNVFEKYVILKNPCSTYSCWTVFTSISVEFSLFYYSSIYIYTSEELIVKMSEN